MARVTYTLKEQAVIKAMSADKGISVEFCCLCGCMLHSGGNNPWPVGEYEDGLCCDECNIKVVVPARVSLAGGEQ